MLRRWTLVWMLGPAAAAIGCEPDPGDRSREYMPDMVASIPYDSFDPNPVTRDGRTLMRPPPGTVPRGFVPTGLLPGPEGAKVAAETLQNPTPENAVALQRGEEVFARVCTPCHGATGQGDGLVARLFPRPPSLLAAHAQALPDGQIFHIITHGQGLMPAHGQQVAPRDRWLVARHIRKLQAAAAAETPANPEVTP